MKDKLEPNMYVRTKWGYICKIININDFREPSMKYGVEASYLKDIMFIGDDDILKASYNIIDILECGDYANGKKIVDVGCLTNGPRKGTKVIDYYITPSAVCYLENEDIKSIVTKEQFEQMSYKVGE